MRDDTSRGSQCSRSMSRRHSGSAGTFTSRVCVAMVFDIEGNTTAPVTQAAHVTDSVARDESGGIPWPRSQ